MPSAAESVLVVDDEPCVRKLVEDILAGEGYPVFGATDPWEALGVAEERPVRLLLTDVVMPDMNGRELARRIETIRPDTKILFMSACPIEGGPLEESAHFIAKPFSVDAIIRAVGAVLGAERVPAPIR